MWLGCNENLSAFLHLWCCLLARTPSKGMDLTETSLAFSVAPLPFSIPNLLSAYSFSSYLPTLLIHLPNCLLLKKLSSFHIARPNYLKSATFHPLNHSTPHPLCWYGHTEKVVMDNSKFHIQDDLGVSLTSEACSTKRSHALSGEGEERGKKAKI